MSSVYSVPRETFTQLSASLLSQGYGVRFKALGDSMQPEINHGDVVVVELALKPLCVNDVVLYITENGRPIVHRIIQERITGAGEQFYLLRGDALDYNDGWVPASRIMGRVAAVERGKRRTAVTRRMNHLFRKVRRVVSSFMKRGIL